ncbi:MAG: hypothetical protein E7054_08645 [Lentisphaerae bacterium]|nr:hypothetical protein [Lentisphaerota bacterium]
MKHLLSIVTAAAFCAVLGAADIYVDYNRGNRKNPGTKAAPLDIFARALNKAKPGDTIYILPSDKPIRDAIVFRNKSGEPGKPITVDGMNNIFLGTMPLNPKEWKEFQPGYFKCTRQIGTNMSNRYFMTLKGKIHRMGRFNKAKGSDKFKKLEELLPGEWTIIRGKVAKNTKHRQIFNQDYIIRLPEGAKTPAEAGFEEPRINRISGVDIAKDSSHITVRNVIVKHFHNDGYNFHGNSRNIILENIAAVECGDDAISAHETCLIYVKNFVAIRCSTAICHINKSENHHENVYAEGILGQDIFCTENTTNTLKNAWFKSDSIGGFRLTTRKDTNQKFEIQNLRMLNRNPKAIFNIQSPGKLDVNFSDVKIANFNKVHEFYNNKVTVVKAEEIEAEINEARKRLFAIFGGQLEKALGE